MLTAFGSSRIGAEAAAARARAKAAGIGGPSHRGIFTFGGVRRLGDKMYEAFCLVRDIPEQGSIQIPLARLPQAELFRTLIAHPTMVQQIPWIADRYPTMLMFRRALGKSGYHPTIH